MSALIDKPPFGERDGKLFLSEMNELTYHHINGCPEYKNIFSGWQKAGTVEELPYLHVGLFKVMELKTEFEGIKHERSVLSSSTSGISSKIILDQKSSKLQSESSKKIIADFIGDRKRPLLILDSAKSLYNRNSMSARIAAAMSLRPFSTEIYFLLEEPENLQSIKYGLLEEILSKYDDLLVYGFSWVLWVALGSNKLPDNIANLMKGKKISFVHSGGWKKLEDIKVSHQQFNKTLLENLSHESKVIDYYGLVEQIGIIYPMCEYGARHVPVWADVIVRDSYTNKPLETGVGQLQLLNTITFGAPYHNVLTEDIGELIAGKCGCGRKGKRFNLIGRIPKSELRGCSNVH